MDSNLSKRPNEYIPYHEIEICSNKIVGGGDLVVIGNIVPFYIGIGDVPKVWLKSLSDIKNKSFIDVVEASISKHPSIKIISNNGEIVINIGDTVILETDGNSKNQVRVIKLDLRPLGINIYGDKSALYAGGTTLTGNAFKGTGTFLALG